MTLYGQCHSKFDGIQCHKARDHDGLHQARIPYRRIVGAQITWDDWEADD